MNSVKDSSVLSGRFSCIPGSFAFSTCTWLGLTAAIDSLPYDSDSCLYRLYDKCLYRLSGDSLIHVMSNSCGHLVGHHVLDPVNNTYNLCFEVQGKFDFSPHVGHYLQ